MKSYKTLSIDIIDSITVLECYIATGKEDDIQLVSVADCMHVANKHEGVLVDDLPSIITVRGQFNISNIDKYNLTGVNLQNHAVIDDNNSIFIVTRGHKGIYTKEVKLVHRIIDWRDIAGMIEYYVDFNDTIECLDKDINSKLEAFRKERAKLKLIGIKC